MFEDLTIGLIVAAALLDSINPCVFGVLIFLIAYLTAIYKNPGRMLIAGLVYVAVVYITYFLIGLGIVRAATSIGFSSAFYWVAASIAIIAGLLEIKDFFWYGKGFSLQMIPGAAQRVKYYTRKIADVEKKHPLAGLAVAGFLGFFVVLVELPCTGAPYLAILALISTGFLSRAVPYLLLYNLIFILPLIFIIGLAYFGKSSDVMEQWRKRHSRAMRLGVGLFLLALGGYMIYTVSAF